MDFTDALLEEFNKISLFEIDRSQYRSPEEVIALFMNSSAQKHNVRIQYLAKAYEEGLKEVLEAAEVGAGADDLYDDNILPVTRAISFSLNELLVEMDGDVGLCRDYISGVIGSVPEVFEKILGSRVRHDKQDSLSRILEGQDMCAALVINEQKVVSITTNAIHLGKKGGVVPGPYHGYLNRVMNYLINGESEGITRESIFLEICKQRLAQEAKNGLSLPEELFSHISKELMNDHQAWRDRSPNQTMELLRNSGITSPLIRHKILSAYSILDRTAHDFKKVEEEFRDKHFRYEILAEAGEGRHAEMKMIDHLLENVLFKSYRGLPKNYISISKLCCADCQSSIEALNSSVQEIYGITDFITYGSTSSREGHGQKFGGWKKPNFIDGDIANYDGQPEVKKICEAARKSYKPAKEKERKDWQDMYATESESDEEEDNPSTSPRPGKPSIDSNQIHERNNQA
jgi:hypothetical protein